MKSDPDGADLYFPGSGAFTDSRLAPLDTAQPPTHFINRFSVDLRCDPEKQDRIDSQLLYGESVTLVDRAAGYAKVINHSDGYQGWINAEAISPKSSEKTFWVSVPVAHLYHAPNLKTANPRPLPFGAKISIPDGTDHHGFLKTKGGEFIFAKHCRPYGHWFTDPVAIALQFLHAPYLWGGRTAMGIDCSALMQVAFAACGVSIHRDSDLQRQWNGESVTTAQRGDLAFFPGHVGIMMDETQMLHANATHMKVTINPLNDVITWVEKEGHKTPFLGFKRLIP